MDIISAYREVGTYRGAAELCDTSHKTVKRIVDKFEADQAGERPPPRAEREHNYEMVTDLVIERVEKSQGRISAKRILPIARKAGYKGSDRHFRRLVAEAKNIVTQRPSPRTTPRSKDARRLLGHRLRPPSAGCTCSAPSWPTPAGDSLPSPPTRKPPPHWHQSPKPSTASAVSRKSPRRPHGMPQR